MKKKPKNLIYLVIYRLQK